MTVDGYSESINTHRANVGDLLLDLGIQPEANDHVTPPPSSPVTRNLQVVIERAQPVRILADGRDLLASSWGATPGAVLRDAGITIDTYDEVLLDGAPVAADSPLPQRKLEEAAPTFDRGFAWDAVHTQPIQLRVYRAIPIVVHEGGLPYVVDTTAQTVGEALRQAEVILYLGDRVHPSLGSRVSTDLNVYIERSVPVAVQVDGRQVKTRTQAKTVGDALSVIGITVAGLDRVEPPLETALYDNIKIAVTRINEDVEVEEEIAPYETVFVGDPNLPIDSQEVLDPGANGITRTRYRVRYEGGEEVARAKEDTWVAQEPAERRIAYGQGITPQTAVVDGQAITYWRKFKAYATSYSPAAVGGNRTTYTGDQLRKGIIAVDPRIIPLRSQMFVPGYGQGVALDTGGGIISRRIDLGYEDADYVSTSKWVDAYLLWPPPPDYEITWVLPNYPPVPQ
jgi:resuscitation-promoting factor RpfB